jgi:hypothetical protein
MRCTCNLSLEQERFGYDKTLAAHHKQFVDRILSLEWKIVSHQISWHEGQDGAEYLVNTIEVDDDAENILDDCFMDVL